MSMYGSFRLDDRAIAYRSLSLDKRAIAYSSLGQDKWVIAYVDLRQNRRVIAYGSPKPDNKAVDYGNLWLESGGDCSSSLCASVNIEFVFTDRCNTSSPNRKISLDSHS